MLPLRSTRLQPLQDVADQREDEAMRALAQCQRLVVEHEQRLAELQRYIQDYGNTAATQSTPALISNRHAFLSKLREAEAFQKTLLVQSSARCEAERARWLLKRRDSGVLEQLAASYRL